MNVIIKSNKIKHVVRDISVFLISWSGIALLYRLATSLRMPLVKVVSFHDIDDPKWFSEVIVFLKQNFHLITPDEFHRGLFSKERINVLVTFDDGYESWVTTCLSVLEANQVKALFFLNSGLLNASGDSEVTHAYVTNNLRLSKKQPLTWEGARVLIEHGHTIGGHTVNHKSLGGITATQVIEEVENDKKDIEARLNITIHDFAYPFGIASDYSKEAENLVRSAGYTYVYTALPKFVHTVHTHIPRTLIEKHQSVRLIKRWLYGSYDVFTIAKQMFSSMRHSNHTPNV